MFFEEKGLCPLGVRPCICVLLIFLLKIKIYSNGSGSIKCAYHSEFLNIYFLLFLWTCKLLPLYVVFSKPINIWEFFAPCFITQVGLQFGTVCPNMSTNINVNFHTRGDGFISYNSMLIHIFIP
jgi:hypothetical protein